MLAKLTRYLPAGLGLPVLLVAFSILAVNDEWLWEWDHVIYDWHLKQWSQPAPDDVVIVAIDQRSLNQFGRWPWPRSMHTQLLKRLQSVQAGPVAFDVIFADPDETKSDAEFVAAVKHYKNIVFGISFEQIGDNEYDELLPFQDLAAVAQYLGHNSAEFDRDSIIRTVHLQSGLGSPYWNALALELLRLAHPNKLQQQLPGRPSPEPISPTGFSGDINSWVRDYQIWIPFIGPPGHFQQVSYYDVLTNDAIASTLQNKIILIGFTAIGFDEQPTPVSAQDSHMSGVEIHANIFHTLREGRSITPLTKKTQALLTLLSALLPLLLYPRLTPRIMLPVTLLILCIPLSGSILLLHYAYSWFPPATSMIVIFIGYILWSWQRLRSTVRYLNEELQRLSKEPSILPRATLPELDNAMEFLRHALPVKGCVLYSPNGTISQQWGQPPPRIYEPLVDGKWLQRQDDSWAALPTVNGRWQVGIRWQEDASQLNKEQEAWLEALLKPYINLIEQKPVTSVELVQLRISQVQKATERLRSMREFITSSMAQMVDGVLVIDSVGQVLLFNPQAALYITGDEQHDLSQQALVKLLSQLEFTGPQTWQQCLSEVLIEHQVVQLPARSQNNHDLLVQLAPFADAKYLWSGMIVSFVDISELRASERRRAEMLSFLSHDLRSPLASVIALTQLAHYKPEKLASGELTEQIEQRIKGLLGLVDDFLQLARAESSDEITLSEINIVPCAEQALEQVKPLAEAKQTQLHEQINISEAWLQGNHNLLERTLINLLSNAIKYSPAGATVELGVDYTDQEIHCWVKDTGYGIAVEHINTLFDRFQRIKRKEHRQESGTGLGLAFVKTVVDRHHGRIEIESKINQGSCFYLYFPRYEHEVDPQQHVAA